MLEKQELRLANEVNGRGCTWATAGVFNEAEEIEFASQGPEKWKPAFPRDKRGTRLRGDHAQTKR
jgi:hypothetical protein